MPQINTDTTTPFMSKTSGDTQVKTMWVSSHASGKSLFVMSGEDKKTSQNSSSKPIKLVDRLTYHKHIKRLKQNITCVNQDDESKDQSALKDPFPILALYAPLGNGAYGRLYKAEFNIENNFLNGIHPIRYCSFQSKKPNTTLTFPFNEVSGFVVKVDQIKDIKIRNEVCGQTRIDMEAYLLGKCVHPNIVSFVGHMKDTECSYILMEDINGRTLKDIINHYSNIKAKTNPQFYFSLEFVMSIFTQLCLAVEYMHRHNIMHRDIKTSNIMILQNKIVKLIDFGFAAEYHGADHAKCFNTVVGTPYYMSPQVIQKLPYTDKADCWALGVVLYELLELAKPFEGVSVSNLAEKIVTEPYRPRNRLIPSEIYIILKALLIKSDFHRPNITQILKYMYAYTGAVKAYLSQCRELVNNIPSNQVALELLREQVSMILRYDNTSCSLTSSQQQQQHIKAITLDMQQRKIALSQNTVAFSVKRNLLFFTESVERKRMEIENDCDFVMNWIHSKAQETFIQKTNTNAP